MHLSSTRPSHFSVPLTPPWASPLTGPQPLSSLSPICPSHPSTHPTQPPLSPLRPSQLSRPSHPSHPYHPSHPSHPSYPSHTFHLSHPSHPLSTPLHPSTPHTFTVLLSCVGYFSSSCSRTAALPRNTSIVVPANSRACLCLTNRNLSKLSGTPQCRAYTIRIVSTYIARTRSERENINQPVMFTLQLVKSEYVPFQA